MSNALFNNNFCSEDRFLGINQYYRVLPTGTQHDAPSMDRTQDLSISSLMLHQATALIINSCAILYAYVKLLRITRSKILFHSILLYDGRVLP